MDFLNKEFAEETLNYFKNFNYKLYGKVPLKFHRGGVDQYEFDLNLGIIHFTELDFKGISEFVEKLNKKWKSEITYCIYPSKESNRDIIINVRVPGAPFEIG